MPLSEFQKKVFLLLKKSRNPESYVAGGTAINKDPSSLRYSSDIDFFHDTDEAVTSAFQSDKRILQEKGYSFEVLIAQPSFYRAIISKTEGSLKLEWVRDTAFRFFPVLEDEEFGYRLHDVDLAVNKCLALANRSEVRDVLDILHLDKTVLSLAASCWAACGKDPGFTPELILEMIRRHATLTPELIAAEAVNQKIDPVQIKKQFVSLLDRTRKILEGMKEELGCVFIDDKGNVIRDLNETGKSALKHFGSVKGSWPRLV